MRQWVQQVPGEQRILSPSNTDLYSAAAAKGKLRESAETATFSYAFFGSQLPRTNFFFHSGLQKSKFCTPRFFCSCAIQFGPSNPYPLIPVRRGPSHFSPDGTVRALCSSKLEREGKDRESHFFHQCKQRNDRMMCSMDLETGWQ